MDRWRLRADGRPRLTLRRIYNLIKHLPRDSATARATGTESWSVESHLLDEVNRSIQSLGGVKKPKPHPQRPTGTTSGKRRDPAVEARRRKKFRDAKRRREERL